MAISQSRINAIDGDLKYLRFAKNSLTVTIQSFPSEIAKIDRQILSLNAKREEITRDYALAPEMLASVVSRLARLEKIRAIETEIRDNRGDSPSEKLAKLEKKQKLLALEAEELSKKIQILRDRAALERMLGPLPTSQPGSAQDASEASPT